MLNYDMRELFRRFTSYPKEGEATKGFRHRRVYYHRFGVNPYGTRDVIRPDQSFRTNAASEPRFSRMISGKRRAMDAVATNAPTMLCSKGL